MVPEEILKDEYSTDEEKAAASRLIVLQNQAHEGALFEDWMRHQAGQKFSRFLEAEIADAKNRWLTGADRDAAEIVRLQTQVFVKIKQWIAAQIVSGKVAAEGIKKFQEEGVKLEGWITDQTPKARPE